jgi:hypothetical protein
MRTRPLKKVAYALLPLLLWGSLTLTTEAGQAQGAPAAPVSDIAAKLNMPVQLELGAAKLPQILRILSDKTGVPIECEPNLADRVVVAQMKDVSARDALDSLAELHEWTWRTTDNGHVVVGRKLLPARIRQSAPAVPAFIQAAIPADIRRFIGAGTTLNVLDKPAVYQDDTQARSDRNVRVMPKTQQAIARLIASLDAKALTHAPLKWEQMTSEQQQGLVSMSVLKALNRTDYGLLYGDHYRFMFDLRNVVMILRNNGTTLITGFYMKRPDGFELLDGLAARVTPTLDIDHNPQ